MRFDALLRGEPMGEKDVEGWAEVHERYAADPEWTGARPPGVAITPRAVKPPRLRCRRGRIGRRSVLFTAFQPANTLAPSARSASAARLL